MNTTAVAAATCGLFLSAACMGPAPSGPAAAVAPVDVQDDGKGAAADATATDAAAGSGPADASTDASDAGGAADAAASCVDPATALHSDPKKLVRNLHQTWQHSPATTLTATWTTETTDLKGYAPKVIAAPVGVACANGAALIQKGKIYAGAGATYTAIVDGSEVKLVAWTVELTDLTPDTDYVFRAGTFGAVDPAAGSITAAELSEVARFRTAPAKGTRQPMDFVVAGDSRGGMAKIKAGSAGFAALPALAWFFSGDMNPLGTQAEWNDWFAAMAPILRSRPLMPVQGNHEVFADVYYGQFALPAMAGLPASFIEHAWSIDVGNVHFVGLDSNTEAGCADQAPWIASDLAKAKADPDIDWTIVQFHHAAYSASNHGSTGYVQKHWVPLFEKHGVDLVFNGHDHNYERSVPIAGGKQVQQDAGVTYVVAGGFFAPPYGNGKKWWTAVSHHGNKNNYVQLAIDGKKATIVAWSGDGKEKLDQVELTR